MILGGIAVIGGFATLALPETMGKMLPDTIDQAENLQTLQSVDAEGIDEASECNSNPGNKPDKTWEKDGVNGGFEYDKDFTAF